jgi:Ca-activated chloride channel homolog
MRSQQVRFLIAALWIVTAIFALCRPVPARADGLIIIDPPFPVPPPDFSQWLTVRYHHVKVAIDDQVATTRVDQVFRNDARVPLEGTYLFPLPPGAVVEDFKMWVDGVILEAEILPAEEARAIYENYVRRQRDPALLEYVGRDTVRASVFPIPPGGERRIQLQYSQVLPFEDRLFRYHYPLNTERFSAAPLEEVSIVVEISSSVDLGPIYSSSHHSEMTIERNGERRATVTYHVQEALPDRDFELYVGTRDGSLGANLLSFKPPTEDGFFLLLLSPSLDTDRTSPLPRDLVLIVDTSGSMEGDKLAQAKAGLAYILEHLNPEDRFNVIAFSSQVRTYAPQLVAVTEADAAIAWVDRLDALGGTNIYLALSEALSQVDAGRLTTLVFLTDGLPTEGIVKEETLLNALQQEAPEAVRIFPLGVGYDVNVLLLDQLAANHRGRPSYITPDERIDEALSIFFSRMQSPLLTDIQLDFGEGMDVYDHYPEPLPDLYAGTQLVVAGRYAGSGAQTLTVSGAVEGSNVAFAYPIAFEEHDGAGFVPRLWAARKIGHLLTQIRIHGETAEWVDAVVSLSLRYGIITPYTSFLIEEPETTLSEAGRLQAGEAMRDQLAEMPAAVSGEQAVDDAKLREGLGSAEAPIAGGFYRADPGADGESEHEVRALRYVGDRTFLCSADHCTDTAYVPDRMVPIEARFMSETYNTLLAADPQWALIFSLATETIAVARDDVAYRFILGEPDELPPTTTPGAATPTPADATQQGPTPTPPPGTPAITAPDQAPTVPSPQGSAPCAAFALLLFPLAAVAVKGGMLRSSPRDRHARSR